MRRITKFSLLLSLVLGLYFPTVFAQSNMTKRKCLTLGKSLKCGM